MQATDVSTPAFVSRAFCVSIYTFVLGIRPTALVFFSFKGRLSLFFSCRQTQMVRLFHFPPHSLSHALSASQHTTSVSRWPLSVRIKRKKLGILSTFGDVWVTADEVSLRANISAKTLKRAWNECLWNCSICALGITSKASWCAVYAAWFSRERFCSPLIFYSWTINYW